MKLTPEKRREIYKEERKKILNEKIEEMRERSIVVFGNILLPIYVLLSSLLIGLSATLYIVVNATEEIREGFIQDPFGISIDLAILAIIAFFFWLMFGMTSLYLFLKSDQKIKEKPEWIKKLRIWNWRKI